MRVVYTITLEDADEYDRPDVEEAVESLWRMFDAYFADKPTTIRWEVK